jgi:hypothetical protein
MDLLRLIAQNLVPPAVKEVWKEAWERHRVRVEAIHKMEQKMSQPAER